MNERFKRDYIDSLEEPAREPTISFKMVVFICVFMYLVFAFVRADWNILSADWVVRFGYIVVCFGVIDAVRKNGS